MVVKRKDSNILHDSVGRVMFSGKPFSTGEIIIYKNGTLVFSNQTARKQFKNVC